MSLQRAKNRIKKLEEDLKRIKMDPKVEEYSKKVAEIMKDAESEDQSAQFLMDQIDNRFRKPSGYRYSQATIRHSVITRARSSGTYEFLRKSGLLKLPSRTTLMSYVGWQTGEVGVTDLAIRRMEMEFANLSPYEILVSLGFDEVIIQEGITYLRNLGVIVGHVNMAGIIDAPDGVLANRMLAFVIRGMSTKLVIPVAYFFVAKLTADELRKLTMYVIQQVEKIGFSVARLVADNHSTNTKLFHLLNREYKG